MFRDCNIFDTSRSHLVPTIHCNSLWMMIVELGQFRLLLIYKIVGTYKSRVQ